MSMGCAGVCTMHAAWKLELKLESSLPGTHVERSKETSRGCDSSTPVTLFDKGISEEKPSLSFGVRIDDHKQIFLITSAAVSLSFGALIDISLPSRLISPYHEKQRYSSVPSDECGTLKELAAEAPKDRVHRDIVRYL